MDPATILADLQLVLAVGKLAVQLGQEAGPFLIDSYNIAFKNKTLTADERADYTRQEQEMRARIDAVIAEDDAATD